MARRGVPPQRVVEAALCVLLGLLLVVHLGRAVLEAPPAPRSEAERGRLPLRADLTVFERADPFGGREEAPAEPQAYADASETTLDLRLVGTALGQGIGTAIIETPDGRQRAYALGQEIVSGVTLRDVRPNQAILNRSGLTETLTLKDGQGGSRAAPRRAPPPRASGMAMTPGESLAALSRAVAFSPIEVDGTTVGYQLQPGAQPQFFEAAGFVEGDIVTAVNGIPAPGTPDAILGLMADMPPGQPITVTVERGGLPLDVPIDLRNAR